MPRRTKAQIAEDRQTEWRELSTFFEQTTMCEGVCGERKICRRKRRSQPWLCKECFLGGQGRRTEAEPELPEVDARDPHEVLEEASRRMQERLRSDFQLARPTLREAGAVLIAVGAFFKALDEDRPLQRERGYTESLDELAAAIERVRAVSVTVPYQLGGLHGVVDHP